MASKEEMAIKEEIKRRLCQRLDEDEEFLGKIGEAVNKQDDEFLLLLIKEVIGQVIEISSSIWKWFKRLFL